MSILTEAFKELKELDDLDFDLEDKDDVDRLSKFLDSEDDTSNIEMIVDIDAEDEEELKDSYVGELLLYCPVCHTIHYAKEEDIVKDEENEEVVNIGDACPHCKQDTEGFEIKGKVAAYEEGEDEPKEEDKPEEDEDKSGDDVELDLDSEEDIEIEDEDEPKKEEGLKEGLQNKRKSSLREKLTKRQSNVVEEDLSELEQFINEGITHYDFQSEEIKDSTNLKESYAPKDKGKTLDESLSLQEHYMDVLYDLTETAKLFIDDGYDVDDAIWGAIDGLIYTQDQFDVIQQVYSKDDLYDKKGNPISNQVDEYIFDEIRGDVQDYYDETHMELDDEEVEESLKHFDINALKESINKKFKEAFAKKPLKEKNEKEADDDSYDTEGNYLKDALAYIEDIGYFDVYGTNVSEKVDKIVKAWPEHIKGVLEKSKGNKFSRSKGIDNKTKETKDVEVVDIKDGKRVKIKGLKIDESKLVEKPVYGLNPQYDSRSSFYGKAQVDTGDKGDQNKLYSYDTLVAEIKDGKPVVYGTYSATTLRHIKEWLKQLGFKAETSKQIMADYGAKQESCKEALEPHKIEIDSENSKIKIDGDEYELLDDNDTYYLFKDKNGQPQEIRKDGTFDTEYSVDESCKGKECDKKPSKKKSKFLEAHYNQETGKVEADLFYGVPEVEFLWHGEVSDPEVAYKGKVYNYYDLEDDLYDTFKDLMGEKEVDDDAFAQWVKDNPDYTYSALEDLDESCKEGLNKSTDVSKAVKEFLNDLKKELGGFDSLKGSVEDIKSSLFGGKSDEEIIDELEYGDNIYIPSLDKSYKKYDLSSTNVNDFLKKAIEIAKDEYEDFDFDEEKFESLVNKYCNKVYENVDNFKLDKGYTQDGNIILEGKLTYKSGKFIPSKFVFEKKETKDNRVKYVGLNETFSNSKRAFTLQTKIDNNKILSESLTYNYQVKLEDKNKPLYGRVVNK